MAEALMEIDDLHHVLAISPIQQLFGLFLMHRYHQQ
jgi:hypothetical protein